MYTQVNPNKEHAAQSSDKQRSHQDTRGSVSSFTDQRSEAIQMKKLQNSADNSLKSNKIAQLQGWGQSKPIQFVTYGPETVRTVTMTRAGGVTNSFEECTKNSVEYAQGEKKLSTGTDTDSPAKWDGWLKNQANANNATQLHVVNQRWGGKGGKAEKNIVPGSPSLNGHHKGPEGKFDECFGSDDKALMNCKYECTATPAYGTDVDVKSGDVLCADPTVSVTITKNGTPTTHPVAAGGGVKFKSA
ncbi:hypothetical protein [Fluviicola sp.]|uniref:hypothetical protein n=1 Tax=Fluviicola sp. TaxID=1917219 RepID=UPI003D2BF607